MGRPPIGKRATTPAERQRRRRQLIRNARPVTKQERLTRSAIARATAPLAGQIRELEGEITPLHCVCVDEAEALHRQVETLRRRHAQLDAVHCPVAGAERVLAPVAARSSVSPPSDLKAGLNAGYTNLSTFHSATNDNYRKAALGFFRPSSRRGCSG